MSRCAPATVKIITEIRYVERETGERNIISPYKKKKKNKIIERFHVYVYVCVCVFKGFLATCIFDRLCVYVCNTSVRAFFIVFRFSARTV